MTTPDDPYAGQPSPEHGATPEQQSPRPGQPPYYGQPTPYYYSPPAPSPPSRVAWFSIGAGSMLVLGMVGLMLLGLILSIVEGDLDEGEFDQDDYETGYVYYVDKQSVLDAVEVPCNRMIEAGDAIELFTDPATAAVSIKAFAVEAEGIADAIDRADPDSDGKQWRDDWNKLAENLETYATNLKEDGNDAFLNTFTELGEAPIMVRMLDSSEANCEIPSVVFAMDADNAYYYRE